MNKTELLNQLSRDSEERLLLARALDRLELARTRNIPACTGFLSPQERASVENLLGASGHPAHLFYGGYEGAERTVCAFLPDWLEGADWAADPDSCPVRAIRCTWSGVKLSHRDFLGAILGLGLDREKVGDLLVGDGVCDILALEEITDFLLLHLDQAGRAKLKAAPLPLDRLEPPEVKVKAIRDTVSSLRLDAVAASGFSLSRGRAAELISAPTRVAAQVKASLDAGSAVFPQTGLVACQGVEGGYAQQACDKVFSFADIMYFRSWEGVFSAVQKGLCRYGVLPIENSANGSVNGVYDLMRSFDFHIVRSVKLHVNHSLLALPGATLSGITEIFSHEQAIGQCAAFLKSMPGVKVTVCENTAMAAKMVADSGRSDVAAISSPVCAAIYGLTELKQAIQDTDNNYTRFIVIAKNAEIYPGADHLSLMFKVGHTPGSLTRILSRFSSLGLNMTKLESRPIQGADFHYMFHLDFEGSIYDPQVVKLLSELERELDLFVFLGAYSEV